MWQRGGSAWVSTWASVGRCAHRGRPRCSRGETERSARREYTRDSLAGIHVHRGDVDAAEAQVAALLAARRSGDPQVAIPGLSVAALVASAIGDVEAAVARLEELEVVTRGLPAWRSFCRVEPLRIAVSLGRPDLGELFVDDSRVGPGWDDCAPRQPQPSFERHEAIWRRQPAGIGRRRNAGVLTAVSSSAATHSSASAVVATQALLARRRRSPRDRRASSTRARRLAAQQHV